MNWWWKWRAETWICKSQNPAGIWGPASIQGLTVVVVGAIAVAAVVTEHYKYVARVIGKPHKAQGTFCKAA